MRSNGEQAASVPATGYSSAGRHKPEQLSGHGRRRRDLEHAAVRDVGGGDGDRAVGSLGHRIRPAQLAVLHDRHEARTASSSRLPGRETCATAALSGAAEGPLDGVRLGLDHAQISESDRIRFVTSLLPIAQAGEVDVVVGGELCLAESGPLTHAPDRAGRDGRASSSSVNGGLLGSLEAFCSISSSVMASKRAFGSGENLKSLTSATDLRKIAIAASLLLSLRGVPR